jgi:hypothetical protein
MCYLAHPEGGGDANMTLKRCHPGAREAFAHERPIAPAHLALPRSVAQPDESLHPIHLPVWTGKKDDLGMSLGMTANRPGAGMRGTPKRSFLKALLASPLLTTASAAQANRPLRVGYIVAKWDILGRILGLKQDAGSGALEQMVLAEFCTQHFANHVPKLNKTLAAKLQVLREALAEQFGTEAEFGDPEGGIYLWIKLPDQVDTSKLDKSDASDGG